MKAKKLTKSNKNKMIAGVCSGIAEYFNVDPTIVRIVFLVSFIWKGAGFLLYLVMAIVMPSDLSNYEDEDVSHLKSANADEDEAKNNRKESMHSDEEFNSFFKKDSK